jgi:hypothetical protein
MPMFTAIMQHINPLLPGSPELLSGFVGIYLLQLIFELTINNTEEFHAFLVENENINDFRPLVNLVQAILNIFYNEQEILLNLMINMLARYFSRIANLHSYAGNL